MNKISVCIATYNGEKYIKEQLDSILPQLKKLDEIIISDDNSKDKTLKIIKSLKESRIKIFTNPKKGLISNFENAITKSSGDYIFLSDQDDIWHENKIQICMNDLNCGYDLVLSDCTIFDSVSSTTKIESYFSFYKCKKGILYNTFVRNSYVGCCMAFNSKIKNKTLPFPKHLPMHDSWIGINAEIYFKVKHNNKKLVNHRFHDYNASETGSKKGGSSFFQKLIWRLSLSYYLLINYITQKLKLWN